MATNCVILAGTYQHYVYTTPGYTCYGLTHLRGEASRFASREEATAALLALRAAYRGYGHRFDPIFSGRVEQVTE